MKQKIALGILKTGKNVFLTGSAGTGKTHLLNQYTTYLKERNIEPAIVAPTGIAASHIGGMTIHSFFGIGVVEEISNEYLEKLLYRKFLHKRLAKLKVLIIDEVSMVAPELFISMDKILRAFKYSQEPFGGVQLILSGDFFQLPPVSSSGKDMRFAWQTDLWRESKLKVCYLEEKFRQDDEALITILDEIRCGDISEASMNIFRSCYKKKLKNKFRATRLYTHNVDVNKINETELNKIKSPLKTFQSLSKGSEKNIEKIFRSSLVTDELKLKKGAAVIFIKNNLDRGYINGTLGKVVDFDEETELPVVEIFSGRRIVVGAEDWMIENDKGEIKASLRQLPLRLAWSLTVHKSQGMTLDAAEVDLSKTFEAGQGYVALSRIRSVEGLRLMGMNETALRVDELVLKIDQQMIKFSRSNETKFRSFSEKEKDKMFQDFIINSGGTTQQDEIKENKRKLKEEKEKKEKFFEEESSNAGYSRGRKRKKGGTLEITKELLIKRKTILEISKERRISKNTVVNHIQEIVDQQSDLDISYLKPKEALLRSVSGAVKRIKKKNNPEDFLDDGRVKLRSIFKNLNEEVPYDNIKITLFFVSDKNN